MKPNLARRRTFAEMAQVEQNVAPFLVNPTMSFEEGKEEN
jgi:hypothetical protein